MPEAQQDRRAEASEPAAIEGRTRLVILDLIHFPSSPEAALVPALVRGLGLVYAPSVLVMYALALVALRRFRLSRSDQRAHLERLHRVGEQKKD